MNQHPLCTLSLHNITLHRGGYCVLENVNTHFLSGTCTLLCGANGSGKTTLLRAVSGLLPVSSGIIQTSNTEHDLSQTVHFIANEGGLKLNFTVAEQIGFWCSILNNNGASHADQMHYFPNSCEPHNNILKISEMFGLKNLRTSQISMLSSGQKRRLSLARLFCVPRPIWCLDEPTNALDKIGLDILLQLMQQHIAQNGIIIVATHVTPLIAGEIQLNIHEFSPKSPVNSAIAV